MTEESEDFSFVEHNDIEHRIAERRRLLAEGNDGVFEAIEDVRTVEDIGRNRSFALTANTSNTSLKSENVLINDNKSNIDLNESQTKPEVNTTSDPLFQKLRQISPNRRRVPLSQRLNSIARTYGTEDNENIEYMDSDVDDYQSNRQTISPTKPLRQTPLRVNESPPKKRSLLSERLNRIAKSYEDSDDVNVNHSETNERKEVSPKVSVVESNPNNIPINDSESPPKKRIIEKVDTNESNNKKWPTIQSPVKSQTNRDFKTIIEVLNEKESKTPVNGSPLKKPIESKQLNEKLTQFGYQRTGSYEKSDKLIYNSSNDKQESPVVMGSGNVSSVRKQFEPKSEENEEKPETLSLREKALRFEKAILAENEAKSKQYCSRKAPTPKPIMSSNERPLLVTNKVVETIPSVSNKTDVKSKERVEKQNNIVLRKQFLKERLFGSETTTANAYKKELESRHKELELLKRPLKRNNCDEKSVSFENTVENIDERPQNESFESVDNETAHQAVCEAFEDIENYTEQSDEEIMSLNLNNSENSQNSDSKLTITKSLDIEYESPTKRNRLYPQLSPELNDFGGESSDVSAPAKPPRVYEQNPEVNKTPIRTISCYRREQLLKATTPTVQTVVLTQNDIQKRNEFDFSQRNAEISAQIDKLKQEVDEQMTITGQASQAINLCLETDEFKGSAQQVEAEKVLLISGQKRIVFLNEIQKLKNKLNDKTIEMNETKGNLSLSNLRLPLKGEFLVKKAKGLVPEIYHFICIVYNGANVFVTNLLNTKDDIRNGSLDFEFGVRLSDLSNDFQTVVHIYELSVTKNQFTHNGKHSIKSKRTPKKNKSSMKSPTVRSPGGPNSVLSSSFQLVGVVNINVNNYHKNGFKLENFNFQSQLEGCLNVRCELSVQYDQHREGFFDVRDNITGYWNLRWVVFDGHHLKYWRFPEDVNTKPALGSINLIHCINPTFTSCKQSVMRPNTVAIITTDCPKNILSKGGSIASNLHIKHLLSTENKDKCKEWSQHLARALKNFRVWDTNAAKAYSTEVFNKIMTELD